MRYIYSFDENTIPFWIKAIYWGLYMLVFVYAIRKTLFLVTEDKKQREVSGLFVALFALYAVFYCINSDYFNYRNWLNVTNISYWNKEKVYLYLVLFCRSLPFNYPYEVFRLIVWGGGVYIVYQTYLLYRKFLLPGLTLLLLFVCYAGTFSYARASLAMAVYFFGIALYLNYKKRSMRFLGIFLAIFSYFFHREMLIGIVLLPCLFIPFERKEMSFFSIFLLLSAIIAISFVGSNLSYLDQIFDNDEITSKIEKYNAEESKTFRISTFVRYFKHFFSFYLVTRFFKAGKVPRSDFRKYRGKILCRKKVPNSIIGMYRITFGILLLSVAFMIIFGLRSVYSYRILYMSMIPLTLMIGYGYNKGYFTKWQFVFLMLVVLLNNSSGIINAT